MSGVFGYDLDRVGKPIQNIATHMGNFVSAYHERTKAVEKQADALTRLADVAEGKVLVS